MRNFWQRLNKSFSVLAPMDGVSDVVFREIIFKLGRPDVFFTEFTNVEALNSKGRETQIKRLKFSKKQKPIVAQLWGTNPDNFYKASKLVKKLGFDGIDLNMGCPERAVRKNGACSALIEDRILAKEIISATLEGGRGLPVSIKTRLGKENFDKSWFEFLFGFKISALTIHLRTVKDLSLAKAKWEFLEEIVDLKIKLNKDVCIIGNGDISFLYEGKKLAEKYSIDGFMIGRGIFKNPWIFSGKDFESSPVNEKLKILLAHTKLFNKIWGGSKNFAIMKKFFKVYCSGFEGAADLRAKLMECKSKSEVEEIILYETFETRSRYPTKRPMAVATPPIINISSADLKGL